MNNDITLSEIQEFIAGFWYDYDQGHFAELGARFSDEITYVSRSESGDCPFEELLAAELHGGSQTLAWMTTHRNENPYPLRHHATNVFRTGSQGGITTARFYLYVNQIRNGLPFDVSSGMVDVGIRRDNNRLVFTSMKVVLDTEDSIPFAEYAAKSAATAGH